MNKKLLFIAASMAMFFFGIACVAIGTINEYLSTTFHVDKIFIGVLAAILSIGSLLGSTSFGLIVDRFGYKTILTLSVFFNFLALEGIAYTDNLVVIQLMILLIGFGGGIINGSANALIADIYETKKGSYLSFLGVFWGSGALALPLITTFLLNFGMQYQSIISLIGWFVLIPVIFLLFLTFPKAKQSEGIPFSKVFIAVKDKTILLIAAFLFFQSGVEAVVNNWTPKYLQDVLNISTEKSLIGLSVLMLSLTFTRLILSVLLKKIEPYKMTVICLFIALVGILILLTKINSYPLMLLGIAFIGIGLCSSFPIMLSYAASVFSELSGTVFSAILFISLVGNIILNSLSGYVFEHFGMDKFSNIMICELAFMFVFLIFFIKRINKMNLRLNR